MLVKPYPVWSSPEHMLGIVIGPVAQIRDG